jgi:nucleotide-binding universal stress UspA family protein
LARQYGADLHALHVVDERREAQTPALGGEELLLENLEERAHEVMDDIVADATTLGLDANAECARGVPHEEIAEYVRRHDVDLIVMDIHGLGGTDRPHIGSTTDRVLRTSDVPVLPV